MYYYSCTDQATTNGSANTDTLLEDFRAIAGLRAQIRKLQLGVFAAPTDNNVRIRLQRTTTAVQTTGTFTAPKPNQVEAPAAATLWQTGTNTLGTGVLAATAMVSLSYNMRGTAMWAAFIEDETISIAGTAATSTEIVINSQASVASVPVTIYMQFSE
jgi:hypothetical protein